MLRLVNKDLEDHRSPERSGENPETLCRASQTARKYALNVAFVGPIHPAINWAIRCPRLSSHRGNRMNPGAPAIVGLTDSLRESFLELPCRQNSF